MSGHLVVIKSYAQSRWLPSMWGRTVKLKSSSWTGSLPSLTPCHRSDHQAPHSEQRATTHAAVAGQHPLRQDPGCAGTWPAHDIPVRVYRLRLYLLSAVCVRWSSGSALRGGRSKNAGSRPWVSHGWRSSDWMIHRTAAASVCGEACDGIQIREMRMPSLETRRHDPTPQRDHQWLGDWHVVAVELDLDRRHCALGDLAHVSLSKDRTSNQKLINERPNIEIREQAPRSSARNQAGCGQRPCRWGRHPPKLGRRSASAIPPCPTL